MDENIENLYKIWKISRRVLDSVYLPKNIESIYLNFDGRCCDIIDTRSRYKKKKAELLLKDIQGKYLDYKIHKDLYIQELKRLRKYYLKHKKILDNSRNILTITNIGYL